MTDKDIHDAFERMKPDKAAQERMLQNILRSEKKPVRVKKHYIRRTLLLAAAIAAAMSVIASANGSDFFGLWSVGIRNREIYSPVLTDDGYVPGARMVDMISLQGFIGSPEYQACVEWQDFEYDYLQDYDFNDDYWATAEYDAYSCYDEVMREKIDDICERYDLKLLGPRIFDYDPNSIFSSAGGGNVLNGTLKNGVRENEFSWGYIYPGGTFAFEGTVFWDDGSVTNYQFTRNVKGYFNTVSLNVGDLDEYEQWEYTTENGVKLLLALGPSKGLIFADREKSFVNVNILGDIWEDGFYLTKADIEAIAEGFDLSAIL